MSGLAPRPVSPVAKASAQRAGPVIAVSLLSGCMVSPGAPTLEAELTRVRDGAAFRVISVSPQEAVIDARGRPVVVSPGPGSCINPDTLDLADNAAFMLLTDCALELGASNGQASATRAGERLHLDRGFPGLVTVSVSGDARGTLESLERFVASDAGKVRLARGSDGGGVEIAEMREIDDALFVLARSIEQTVPILSNEFWRAFVEVNERLVLVTVSAFQANELEKEAMFTEALGQVEALRAGNNGVLALAPSLPRTADITPVRAISRTEPPAEANAEPEPLPEAAPEHEAQRDDEPQTPADALPQIAPVPRAAAGDSGPVPPQRPAPGPTPSRRAATPGGAIDAGPQAPERAPAAPRRRGA
ncbi:MAG: hypothetical protein AAFP17_14495 [Pseudomonadota bacterium]